MAFALDPSTEFGARVARRLADAVGDDVVTVSGRAAVSDDPPAHELPRYLDKYGELIERNGWTPESFAADYSVPVRIRPTGLRGF
jgi:hypothetical protein